MDWSAVVVDRQEGPVSTHFDEKKRGAKDGMVSNCGQ
jgi:hypothetical protein